MLLPLFSFAQTQGPTEQKDIIDVFRQLLHEPPKNADNEKSDKTQFSLLPAAGYTLQTGAAAVLAANAVFKTSNDSEDNTSTVSAYLTYTQYQQIILPLQTYIWTKNNKYNIVTDWRFIKYPQYTYGLGGFTSDDDKYRIDYSNIHLYQTLMRHIAKNTYAGIGYNFDYYWNVQEIDPPTNKPTDFSQFGSGVTPTVTASGITFTGQYDSRRNPINAQQGSFARVTYRTNLTALGSDANWQSLIADLRHYFTLPGSSQNVLAFWSYDWFTVGGTPSYLMLPSTGWDPFSNTGRGYIQGRYRGKNMLYLEGEYRFRITHNGLIGGVVFANGESFTEPVSNRFETVAPAAGAGIRIKLNKFSNTNIAVDYSFGQNGSRGFFVNLGEVF